MIKCIGCGRMIMHRGVRGNEKYPHCTWCYKKLFDDDYDKFKEKYP